MWDELHYELSERIDLAAINTANLWYSSMIDSGMSTSFNSTDLNLIEIDLSEIPDPWRPVIPSNTSITTTIDTTAVPTGCSSTSNNENSTSQESTSWRLSPIFFLISICFLVKMKKIKNRKIL